MLECGVGWAAILLNDLVDHWEKRRPEGLEPLDPAGIDWDELEALMREHGPDLLAAGDDVARRAAPPSPASACRRPTRTSGATSPPPTRRP